MLDYLFELFKKNEVYDLHIMRTKESIYHITFSYGSMRVKILENEHVDISSDLIPFDKTDSYPEFVEVLKNLVKLSPRLKKSADRYLRRLSSDYERNFMEQ